MKKALWLWTELWWGKIALGSSTRSAFHWVKLQPWHPQRWTIGWWSPCDRLRSTKKGSQAFPRLLACLLVEQINKLLLARKTEEKQRQVNGGTLFFVPGGFSQASLSLNAIKSRVGVCRTNRWEPLGDHGDFLPISLESASSLFAGIHRGKSTAA